LQNRICQITSLAGPSWNNGLTRFDEEAMRALVTFRKCDDYDPGHLASVVQKILEDLGGATLFFKRGDRVLLKPNLLMASGPSAAVVTHPAFVEAVAALVIDAGATPFVGDSPPIGHLARALTKSGYDPFMKRMGIQAAPFLEKTAVEFADGRLFRRLDLAREVFEFDAVINLAKLKTHSQMFLTLAVKNLFGTVIGSDKATWHLRAGKDYESFATVLAQILEAVNPRLSIVDGILGMEGKGPSGGSPRQLGIIGASADAVALDACICRLLGFKVENLRTCVVGESLGIGTTRADQIDVVGDTLHKFPLKDFKPPRMVTVTWDLSAGNPARRFLEKRIATRPRIDSSRCSGCRTCLTHCPPQAISEQDGSMVINYEKCISCFCCQELCSEKAIDVVEPLLGRLLSRFSR
jgi:uncharacterized protein (DUF362 family)/Pyruvate/2-oxoacid:ferredoxin oxidoreductase delta subunit